jgi:hypothetical protein
MRRFVLLAAVLLAGCSHQLRTISTAAALGRVVIYRNGVAFYERKARIEDGHLTVRVPRDRVDDFLKSLTVVDPTTRKPLAVSIPREQSHDGSYLTMSLETQNQTSGDVLLTYVTEAPAWKPSYRVVVGAHDKVMLEGWAIVDNVSGEDWKDVLVGVGASSALSFRYDLWSVRRIDRDLLEGDAHFAIAPPTGMAPYAAGGGDAEEVATFDGDISFSGSTSMENGGGTDSDSDSDSVTGTAIKGAVRDEQGEGIPGVTVIATSTSGRTSTAITNDDGSYAIGVEPGRYKVTFYYADKTIERTGIVASKDKQTNVWQKIDLSEGGEAIVIRDTAPTIEPTSTTQGITIDKNYIRNIPGARRTYESALGSAAGSQSGASGAPRVDIAQTAQKIIRENKDALVEAGGSTEQEAKQRGEAVKNQLVDAGIAAGRIQVRPLVGSGNRVRVLAVAPAVAQQTAARAVMPDTPVGESHFMTERPMTVKNGTSAMVATVTTETTGGVVYLYDPISDRGDARFAFKAVRLDNPTDDTLEAGPVTVYGDGRFVGEGITEAVPPRATVVVPFALDRQVVVTRSEQESDRIAKLVTVERGIVTAELQHRRTEQLTLTSRLHTPTKVYVRHRLESGWTLVEAPPEHTSIGDSKLFVVELAPGETRTVTIAQATPIERRLDLASDEPLDMMKLYVDDPEASPKLKAQIEALLAIHREAADLTDQIATLRDQAGEYRQRTGELHAQLVTLKAVRTARDLRGQLAQRLGEMNERSQKATLAIVDAQEKLMLARVKFQNQLADLRIID